MKNKLLVAFMVLMLFASVAPLSVGGNSVSSYIRGLWHFDEGTGTTAYDSSGNNNHGTVYGGAMWTDGKVGKALDFDGGDDYVEVPDSNSLDITGKITLEAWIYPHTMTHLQVIVAKYNHSAPYNGAYYLGLGGYGYMDKILFGLSYDGLHFYYMLSNANITANTWTQVAATSNGTHMILYINGNKDSVRTYSPVVIYASTAPLRIGCYLPELGFPRFFDGVIDEVKVSATTIWTVDDDRVQCPTADFTEIQDAIDAASPGDTIYVYDGTYTEQLIINKTLTLHGDPGPRIVAPDTRNTYTIAESSATWDPIIFAYGGTESGGAVSGSGTISVTIDGFEIDGGNKAVSDRFVGILYRNVNPGLISNNTINDMYDADGEGDGPQTFGIMVYGDSDVTVEFNEIRDFSRGGIGVQGDGGTLPDPTTTVKLNTVAGNGLEAGTGWWAENGIQIAWGAGGSIIENDVSGCQVNSPSWVATGIMVYDAVDGVNTLNNSVADCDTGIAVISPSYDLVDGNVVTGCTWDGIRLGWPVDHCTVTNNIISGSWAGIGVWDASDNTIEDNVIEDNEYGIYMDGDSHNNVIILNDILDNVIDGIHIEPYYVDPSGTKVHYNNIVGNGVCGVNKTGTEIVDARFNWWGDVNGPFHNDTNLMALGNKVTDNVTYSPWLGFVAGTTPMTYHVNPTGKIQDAIDDASSGDTIFVHDGTYNEALYINKTLAIKTASKPVIKGSQSFTTNYMGSPFTRKAVIFVVNSTNVVIEGLDIEGEGLSGYNAAVVYVYSGGEIKDCVVSPNTVGDMYSLGVEARGCRDLSISRCTIMEFGRIGAYFANCTGGVYDSEIIGQVYSDDNKVNYGIEVEPHQGACVMDIIGNEIYNSDNTYSPEPLWSSAGIVIDGWKYYQDTPSSTVVVSYNDIHDNYHGIEVAANSLSYARCNKIYDNREYGVISTPDSFNNNVTFNSVWNWWGSDTGPYHPTTNPSGTGDEVSDYVDYEPWKTQATLKVEPSTYQAKRINETFSINVTINDLSEDWKMVSVQFRLSYNSTLLEVLDVTEGPFIKQAGLTLFIYQIEDDGIYGPHVLVGILLMPQWTTFPYGSGTLATITFNATYCQREDPTFMASCDLTLLDTIIVNSDVEDVLHNVENGHYEIECHICDLNMDGRVDMRDISYAARAFGAYPGHPRWDPVIDINGDGMVNMRDIAYVARAFGWDC